MAGAELSGLLVEQVALEAWSEARDDAGAAAGEWLRAGDYPAAVVPDGDGRRRDGEARRQRARWRVTLRTPVAVTLTCRLVWRGMVLTVLAVDSDPRHPDRVSVRAEGREG